MKAWMRLFAVFCTALFLTACPQSSNEDDDEDARVEDQQPSQEAAAEKIARLSEELDAVETRALATPSGPAPDPADADLVIDALPEEWRVTYGAASYEEDSGALLIEDMRIVWTPVEQVAITIDAMRFWDFDAEFVAARLRGERLEDEGAIASRIEASGLSTSGLEVMVGVLDAQIKALVDSGAAFDRTSVSDDVEFLRYDLAVERLVFDTVALLPFDTGPQVISLDDPQAEDPIGPLRQIIAFERSLAAEATTMTNARGAFDFVGYGSRGTVDFSLARAGSKGWRGYDVEESLMEGLDVNVEFDTRVYNWDFGAPAEWDSNTVGFSIGSAVHEGLRMDQALTYLLAMELPDLSETDLLTFGVMKVTDTNVSVNNFDVVGLEYFELDLSKFHWLTPTRFGFNLEGLSLDFAQMVDLAASTDRAMPVPPDAAEVISLLERYNLSPVVTDFSILLDWNPDNGGTLANLGLGVRNLGRIRFESQGVLPSFDSFAQLFQEAGDFDQDGMSQLFMAEGALNSVMIEIVDDGGLEAGFDVFREYAAMSADETPELQRYADMTTDELRLLASELVVQAAGGMGESLPFVTDYANSVADFIQNGGSLRLTVRPREPLTAQSAAQLSELAGEDPNQLVDVLGVRLEHLGGN